MPGISPHEIIDLPWWDSLSPEQQEQALAWVREHMASPTRTVSDEAVAWTCQREIAEHYGWPGA